MRHFCRITTRWGKSELQRCVRNIREGRLAVTDSCWNVVKSQHFPQKCDTDLSALFSGPRGSELLSKLTAMWNMRNVVWRTDVCSSQVAGNCTTCQLMAFMIWQKLNEFCITTWENGKVYFKYESNSIKSVMDDTGLTKCHAYFMEHARTSHFPSWCNVRVIQNNFNMLRIEMRVTGTDSLGAGPEGGNAQNLRWMSYSEISGFSWLLVLTWLSSDLMQTDSFSTHSEFCKVWIFIC